jgi:hypothetical protein
MKKVHTRKISQDGVLLDCDECERMVTEVLCVTISGVGQNEAWICVACVLDTLEIEHHEEL